MLGATIMGTSRGGTGGVLLLASLGRCVNFGEVLTGPGRAPVGEADPLGVLLPLVFTGVTSVRRMVPVLFVSTVVCVPLAILPAVVLGLIVSKSHSMDSLSEFSEALTRHRQFRTVHEEYSILISTTLTLCAMHRVPTDVLRAIFCTVREQT